MLPSIVCVSPLPKFTQLPLILTVSPTATVSIVLLISLAAVTDPTQLIVPCVVMVPSKDIETVLLLDDKSDPITKPCFIFIAVSK